MFNTNKFKVATAAIIALVVLLIFICGSLLFWQLNQPKETKKVTQEPAVSVSSSTAEEKDGKQFNQELVHDFLVQYYTKTELTENRHRYKPFMTEGMYNSEVSEEEKELQLNTAGYTVDYKFDKADIYLDSENLTVIAEVSYLVTNLAKKNNYAQAEVDVSMKQILRIRYKYENGQYLIDDKDEIFIAGKYNIQELNDLYKRFTEIGHDHDHNHSQEDKTTTNQ
ncbi:hypothetical protein STRDD10_00416 [Streptococcus sp. DD10]|uniref:hypothetical protein n=1 Tax=Streptococcus sp. DD10 TaxID=1777878 RepID=UPI00079856CD|nr:hypothetical protein [Streptococcus sp. DD10]KXT75180.1 hypothetical protein STRDD10_00416 [Streptococcus sp. DD10]